MRLLILVVFLSVIVLNNIKAQDCGTEVNERQLEFMEQLFEAKKNSRGRELTGGIVRVPVRFVIIRRSDGTGGIAPSRIPVLINEVNNVYSGAEMEFFQILDPLFVDSDEFFDLDSSEENVLAGSRDTNGAINIYVSDRLTSGSSLLCGYTRFPPSADRMFLARGCADNETGTTAHELGHYFTLFHTHGKTNTGTTDERVERLGCEQLGDNLCDTEADPNLTGLVSGCSYVGDVRDVNGELFTPDTRNIMSYAPNQCRTIFTQGQLERIRDGLELSRTNLNIVFNNFNARFTSDTRSGCSPMQVTFTDLTSGAIQREWSFEGASVQSSFSQIITVTYPNVGVYDVGLEASGAGGAISTVNRPDFIRVFDPRRNVIQGSSQNDISDMSLPDKWTIINNDKLETFGFSNISSNGDQGSIFIDNFNYNAETIPEVDEIELSNLDFSEVRQLKVSFDYSYTYRPGDVSQQEQDFTDSLEVGFRLECEDEFFSLAKMGGNDLITAEPTTSFFTPSGPEDWEEYEMTIEKDEISGFENISVLRPTIRNICGNGNNLYIDNIVIEPDFSLDSLEFFRTSEVTTSKVVLRWFNPSINELGSVIERSTDGISFEEIGRTDRNVTIFEDTDLPQNVASVFYRAANFNNQRVSNYTPEVEVVTAVTSLENIYSTSDEIKVFPNPSDGSELHIRTLNDNSFKEISVYDKLGKLKAVYNGPKIAVNSENTISIEVSDLSPGIYILISEMSNSKREIVKLIIK